MAKSQREDETRGEVGDRIDEEREEAIRREGKIIGGRILERGWTRTRWREPLETIR